MTTDRIEPALSSEEWARGFVALADRGVWLSGDGAEWLGYDDTERLTWKDRIPALIALANAALPDSDPRKITRAKIRLLRVILAEWDGCGRDPDALDAWINAPDDRPEPPVGYFGDTPPGADGLNLFLAALAASYLPPE